MPTDIFVDSWEAKATDIVHLNGFYVALHDYLWSEEYSTAKDEAFPETYYYETRTQQGGKEVWVWWRPISNKRGTKNNFYQRFFNIEVHGVGVRDAEIMRDNKKWKVQMGKVEVLTKVYLRIDPENKWQKNWFLKMIFEWFWKRMYRKHMEMHKKELLKDSYKFRETVKRLLELNTFAVPQRPFAPAKAFGSPFEYQ
ncbi:hypothetical protein HN695_01450 [Candidatus Woesearchaeota archaeon]|jgi:hypothetical protein|nr:hypothetical protein [Candidatus Woesearchaeota archaeon]MBT5273065.1 hypothetical protein [Candidatus Woesearchaeota archaeon]MBT6040799.1 hypothetical protein [Candidatus Woesearchaeota archaeon]MBT6337620.1 hypothetical protein [Candidatus Woesearchaeota archaeon]MBT7926979.1 hypothetical protein [Candidatus Woesearchaeota archaeon]